MTADGAPGMTAHQTADGRWLTAAKGVGVVLLVHPAQISGAVESIIPRLVLRERAFVRQPRDVLCIGPIGSRNDYLTVTFGDHILQVTTGCLSGSLADFEHEVRAKPEGIDRAEYLVAIDLIKLRAKERGAGV